MEMPPSLRTVSQPWCVVIVLLMAVVVDVVSLNGPNVCMVKQKYNITKRVKYRAPMSVRTYEWCFSMPPRCSRWNTEMRDLTRLETEERTAEVAVCCPGYKIRDVSCVPICPNGKTGSGCTEDCPDNKWGPNCANDCDYCSEHGECSPLTGECECKDGWQGESCEIRMSTTPSTTTLKEELLTTTKSTTFTNPTTTTPVISTAASNASTASITTVEITTITTPLNSRGSSSSISTTVTSPITITSTTETPNMKEHLFVTQSVPTETSRVAMKNTSETIEKQNGSLKSATFLTTLATTGVIDNVVNSTTTVVPTLGSKFNENLLKITKNVTQTTEEHHIQEGETNYQPPTNRETTTSRALSKSIYNRTEIPIDNTTTTPSIEITSTVTISYTTKANTHKDMFTILNGSMISTTKQTKMAAINKTIRTTPIIITSTEKELTNKPEGIRKPETAVKTLPTLKAKPKEIWIKPTQKGESPIIDLKTKQIPDLTNLKSRGATKKDVIQEFTTPRTIIVSIIPTSVSYATFKKIALTTSSYLSTRNSTQKLNKTEHGLTSSMPTLTSLPPFIKKILTTSISRNISFPSTNVPVIFKNTTKLRPVVTKKKPQPTTTTTNSMTSMAVSTLVVNSSNILTVPSQTNSPKNLTSNEIFTMKPTVKPYRKNSVEISTKAIFSLHNLNTNDTITIKPTLYSKMVEPFKKTTAITHNGTLSNVKTNTVGHKVVLVTTEGVVEDETFHILTEPEHITAVMSDRGRDRSSMDLVSVVSIAGGVMMAVITVAVLIVMVERCRRPRFEEVRKDIRMQVMIDNNEAPPPYTRSIFHTPLPEPPSSEKCHYQPISTLDRNLKQFMRPVVVQNISPIMLENFRGILECHYDHLPRRNQDFGTMPTRFAAAPSMSYSQDLRCQKSLSVNDSAIEALKREAKMDVLDSSTSEPLYAEIPCWRPPSEHAIEVVNLNGEAITEL